MHRCISATQGKKVAMDPFEFAAEVDRLDDDAGYQRVRQLLADPAEAMRVAVTLLDASQHEGIAAKILNQVVQDAPNLADEAVRRLSGLQALADAVALLSSSIVGRSQVACP